MEELLTIYEWPEKLMTKELKKLALQQKVEKLQYPEGDFWQSKCLEYRIANNSHSMMIIFMHWVACFCVHINLRLNDSVSIIVI